MLVAHPTLTTEKVIKEKLKKPPHYLISAIDWMIGEAGH